MKESNIMIKPMMCVLFLLLCLVVPAAAYNVVGDTVYENNTVVNLSATPHTISSTGWVYFNVTSNTYNNNFDVAWGFNTSEARPTKAELYSPHWVNTTSDHQHTFYNVTHNGVYGGDNLDYGNSYNNISYTFTHEVTTYNETTMEPDGSKLVISNISFEELEPTWDGNGKNYTAKWYTRHDKWTLWKDKTDTFNTITHDYEGYDTWYYIKDIAVVGGQSYLLRAWVEVPISLTPSSGKYYFAVKPSSQTIPEAIAAGHFYALDPWWDSSWNYYKTITINQTMVNQSIGNVHYTMLVDITDTDLRDHAQADGDDIVFTDSSNTTQLAHQLNFNSTTGALVAYVNVTDISNVTSINMYYNNSGATDTQDKAGTWGVNASGIWLFDEGAGTNAEDSSGNGNNGTIVGADWVPGGLEFDASNAKYINYGDVTFLDDISKMSVFLGIKPGFNQTQATDQYLFDKTSVRLLFRAAEDDFRFRVDADSIVTVDTTGLTWDTNTEHTISCTYNGTALDIYFDGIFQNTAGLSGTITPNANDLLVGINNGLNNGVGWLGDIYYVYFYNRALSADEIATQYNNTQYPALFISLGAEQSDTAGNAPNITSWQNNKTVNNTLDFTINTSEEVNFNATANQTITTWNWYKDTADQSHNYDNVTLNWSSIGLKHVVVNATNANGTSNSITWNVTVESLINEYAPPAPVSLANTTGNFWVNFTWSSGSGNVTDSYNVSQNSTWVNGSSTAFNNSSVSAHGYSDIIVYAYNNSGTGTLSTANISDNVTVPNNVISISNISASYTIDEGDTLSIDADYTDLDGDTPTFNDNSSEWNVNSATGIVSWVTTGTDSGTYHYYINVTDGYSSTDQHNFTVTVNDTIFNPIITLLSQYPSILYQNTTGYFNLSWGIEHSTAGLNTTSLAITHAFYDILNNNYNNSIRYPVNDRSEACLLGDKILRANNRNETTPLNWETNSTITDGNLRVWGGGDENTPHVSIVSINSTYTKIYWNGTAQDTLWPGTWYLDRTEQTAASMTSHAIDKSNHVLIQSVMPGCVTNQEGKLLNMAIDTHAGVTPPVKPLSIFYLNDSYDPLGSINPEDSPYAYLVNTVNASRWTTHTYSVDNSTYTIGFIVNTSAIADAGITPTKEFYVYFNTEAATSKSYYINKTNAATTTNISFAETGTMWIGDNAPYTSHPYTTNAFFMIRSNETQFQHKLYIADNDGYWNNSGLQTSNIQVSTFYPSTPSICSFYYNDAIDYDMNGTYSGEYYVRVLTSNDPDGGNVSHNLTLYYANETYVTTINNSITSSGAACVNVTFDSSSYYSLTDEYTLKVVATDDESYTSEYWLPVNFTLYTTPDPTTLVNTTGNFYVNYTWSAGSGAVTDSYNVSINTTWYNGSSQAWANNSTTPHGSIEIIVYAYNVSSGLSTSNITDNVTVPNNAITITNTSDWSGNEGQQVYLNFDYTDLDGDVGTFDTNATSGNLDTSTGIYTWNTIDSDQGTHHIDFNVTDGYGSTSSYISTITISDSTPAASTNIQNSTSGLQITWNWTKGSNSDYTVVNVNGSWYENSTDNEYIFTATPHGTPEIQLREYNTTLGTHSAYANQTTTIPNNPVNLTGIPDKTTTQGVNLTNAFNLSDYFTDIDSDTPTFAVESNNDTTNLTVTIQADNTVDFNVTATWDGSALVIFNVTDGYSSTDNDSILFSIVNVSANLNNFTFSNESVSPTTVLQGHTSTISIDISDYDGTITTAIVNVRDMNYTMVQGAGNTWTYAYSDNYIGKHHITYFYAQDNDSAWNSTTSTAYINVLDSAGSGGGYVTPTPTLTPTPTQTPEPTEPLPADQISLTTFTTYKDDDTIKIFKFVSWFGENTVQSTTPKSGIILCEFDEQSIVSRCEVYDGVVILTLKPFIDGFYYTAASNITMIDNAGNRHETDIALSTLIWWPMLIVVGLFAYPMKRFNMIDKALKKKK